MARGLFLIIPGHGHVNPTIGLVKELMAKGDEIVYICADIFRDKLEKVGANFVGYSGDAFIRFNSNEGNDNAMTMAMKFIEINKITLELAMKQTGNFDYLVVDNFIYVDKRIINKFNIKKVIGSITTFALNEELTMNLFGNFNSDKTLLDGFKSLKGELIKMGVELTQHPILDVVNKDRADLKIVFTSKYYQPFSENFDETFKFVGPSITNRHELEDFKVENPENKKLIFASLGTVANENLEFYKNCFEALGSREDLIVVMSVGNRINIEDLGPIPKNFKVFNYVPQLRLLKKVDLFITHGGMNSSSEGLYNGVPLIVVPQFGDQPIVAKRVADLGAGIALLNNTKPCDIENAVNTVLIDKSYKENAIKIGESLKNCGGYKKAADLIHEIL
ncbi:MAG: glycosyltransferase [Clostridium perfringens]|nr:glycosyltransferase [Clostridium perfringens]